MNEAEIVYDRKTKELLKRSENIINRSQMLLEVCDIQSKLVADLVELSARLTAQQKEFIKDVGTALHENKKSYKSLNR